MNIVELFPKRKRVVGINPNTGRQTSFALRKSGVWIEMMIDITDCTTLFQLQKCRFVWAAKAVTDLWPEQWVEAASEEFDKAVESVARAQGE